MSTSVMDSWGFLHAEVNFYQKASRERAQIGLGGGPRSGKENPLLFYLHQGRKLMKLGAVGNLEVCKDWAAQRANNQAAVFSSVGSW